MGFWSREIRTTPHYQFPLAERLEDSESEHDEPRYPGLEATKPVEKPRVVVLGTGWAACRFLKGIDTRIYDVVCISPRNHMVFTPLLASTCVGTLEFRSVSEPVTQIQSALATSPNSYFFLASCISLDTTNHEVYCEAMSNGGLPQEPYQFKVAYDKLVIAAGAEPLTFGIKGLPEEEKKRLLHCVIIGGGPTGVEFSGELSDFIRRDVHERYSHVKDYIKVTLIEANEILSSFDVRLRQYATNHLKKSGVHLMRGVVKEVHPKKIILSDGTDVTYGLLVWSTGVEDVFALGDCAGFLEQTGKPVLPALAQVAERQGNMASVGRYKALVDLRQSKDAQGISLAGFVSWLIWRSAYLTRVVSWRNRFYVAVNWATTLVFGRDDSRIG
ncbi:Internal alternative NAD(P)H-ubiquinone oxidoreductase A1 [Hibiscus syriacus]|uniref:NADH:ubiquinone reductase (non-electrogenic) n=1 Tax=Hibiscus syriacus TaxID=106335 RepID=A0A6A3BD81_HIBSY|nr:Internal alternative NAD(P)H-ubiquinone oxidoreductase A1 [Hibiscus syriacus]